MKTELLKFLIDHYWWIGSALSSCLWTCIVAIHLKWFTKHSTMYEQGPLPYVGVAILIGMWPIGIPIGTVVTLFSIPKIRDSAQSFLQKIEIL